MVKDMQGRPNALNKVYSMIFQGASNFCVFLLEIDKFDYLMMVSPRRTAVYSFVNCIEQ